MARFPRTSDEIRWLYVSMNVPFRMQKFQSFNHLQPDHKYSFKREPSSYSFSQRLNVFSQLTKYDTQFIFFLNHILQLWEPFQVCILQDNVIQFELIIEILFFMLSELFYYKRLSFSLLREGLDAVKRLLIRLLNDVSYLVALCYHERSMFRILYIM